MRFATVLIAIAAMTLPAAAGEPYKPLKLNPAELVTPPPELLDAARSFLTAVQQGDGDAIGAGIAPKVTAVDGALELSIKRRSEVLGPFDSTESALVQLATYIGGDYERPEGVDPTPFAIEAERQYIVGALTDGRPWGKDPAFKGATCTYAYRTFDQQAIKALGEKLDTQTSSFFYVDAPVVLVGAPDDKAEPVATLEPDLLYALDYDTDAPGRWIAVHMPEGGSGFLNFDKVELNKPYAAGICFSKDRNGKWLMSGQASTSL